MLKRSIYSPLFILILLVLNPSTIVESFQAPDELFISEYIEGSSNNKALEIYNGTGATVDLAAGGYTVTFYFNGDTAAGSIINLTGSVSDGDVYILADIDAEASIQSEADQTDNANFFNGDDVVILTKNGVIIDVIGQLGTDPGSQWGSGLASTQNNTLRRKAAICEGDTDETNAFAPAEEWEGFVQDNTANLGSHTVDCGMDVDPITCMSPVALTKIHDIQGNGMTSPLVGNLVNVEAVVTADFQTNGMIDSGDLNGFYLQGSGDGNSATSDGIFVLSSDTDVQVGDLVRVQGTVAEFETSSGASSLTEINNVQSVEVCSSDETVPPAVNVTFPLQSVEMMEQYEGMLVNFPQQLVISEYFNYDRFGEIVIANPLDGLERPLQPTAYNEPTTNSDLVDEIARNRITLDDGQTTQNIDTPRHPNGNAFGPSNTFRGGGKLVNTIGVIDDTFGKYRIQPTATATYLSTNPRQATPDSVGGTLKVVSLNVLNYFLTPDNGGSVCGANQNQQCRGADTISELNRQRDKLLLALLAIEADIYGIVEIENTPGVEPLADLVAGMNDVAGANTYDFIDTGVIGSDAIRVGFIYRATTVSPAGNFAILDSSVDPTYLDTKNRPALAQTFEQISTGERVTIAVNHFKSKGSSCDDVGDPNLNDGQGNCSGTRTAAATALANWLANDPTGSDDPDVLIIGDLNAYDREDPIDALKAAGYTDLAFSYGGEEAYSYVFDGQFGYLDYALANASLRLQVTGTTEWHINADEPDIWDYDDSFNDASFYEANVYRVSDHDPVIVGIGLNDDLSFLTNMIYLPVITISD